MADTTKIPTARPRGSALDLPMAVLAGGATGFFVFAMPAALFERLIGATGLAAVVSAAQPPLGDTARLAFVAVAALASFGAVWLLLRKLGTPAVTRVPEASVDISTEAPRLRRADMHPDAPSRRPIRAASDFGVPFDSVTRERGEPVDVSEIENVDFDAEWERPAPAFLTAAEQESGRHELLLDEIAEDQATSTETYDAVPHDDPVSVPFWLPEGAHETDDDEQSSQIEQDVPPSIHIGRSTILPFWAQHTENEPSEEATSTAGTSLDQLSNRLEGGLIRRKRDGRATRPRGISDNRLRGALDDLGKLSGRR
jgi:hypothetical protein